MADQTPVTTTPSSTVPTTEEPTQQQHQQQQQAIVVASPRGTTRTTTPPPTTATPPPTSSGSSSSSEIPPEPEVKHPLQNRWTLWFDNPGRKASQQSWADHLRIIQTFDTVEDFWRSVGIDTSRAKMHACISHVPNVSGACVDACVQAVEQHRAREQAGAR